jgi:hypothetical protein
VTQPLNNPTYILTFLLATPGSWRPLSVNSDTKPSTREAMTRKIEEVAKNLGTAPQFIAPIGVIELEDEPFIEPLADRSSPANKLLVPNGKLIVPGRD